MSKWLRVLLFLLASPLWAQGTADATVPMREERYHRLLFENSRVAVYDVVFPVGATMRFHEHPTDHLAVVVSPGALRNEVRGAAAQVRPPGPAGELVFLPAGPAHRQVNVGQTSVHFIAAEILSHSVGPRAATAPSPAGDPCAVVLDNEAVRALRCKLPLGQSVQVARATSFLRIVVAGDRIEWRAQGAPRQVTALQPGATAWHEPPEAGTLVNVGKQPFEALDIEWK